MPLQNRVTPFGEIIATPDRGLFMGNRGIIHDPDTRTLLSRRWASHAWLVCVCQFKGVRRAVMGGRSWTELFFLDEATALAAGHRPCFYCRREEAERFRAAWAGGKGRSAPSAGDMDRRLHAERLDGRSKRLHPLTEPIGALPDGVMVAASGAAWLVCSGRVQRWSSGGYGEPADPGEISGVLTPPSTVAALSAGYRPILHPSAVRDEITRVMLA